MQHQHASQGTGGYGHSVETEPGGGMAGGQGVGGQEGSLGGTELQSPAGGQEMEPTGGGMQATSGGTQTTSGGVQATGRGMQTSQGGPGLTLDDALTGQMRVALHDAIKSARVCEWCADQCIDEGPGMERCIRLCRDVADLARLNAAFVTRDSVFGPDVARTFAEAAEECALECQQHPHEHCQECARVLRRAARTSRELISTVGGQSTEVAGQLPAGRQ